MSYERWRAPCGGLGAWRAALAKVGKHAHQIGRAGFPALICRLLIWRTYFASRTRLANIATRG